MYTEHEMKITFFEQEEAFITCKISNGGDGWSVDSINPNQSDS